ncbi:hypothetical protein [Hymenobacter cellulosilyticus]|uniref:Uncharacterized protein n=1 Tax=Hymenobacter cellulosilyticus TaxID=2932248 RepID=A0A8T9Q594_9BACT|nr:hypothetical protein [Hymenobacter cellulosilyticus]UOQ72846.1 hypothetical protein MUN79_02315 [Hymenobacter cellulosilyticus]
MFPHVSKNQLSTLRPAAAATFLLTTLLAGAAPAGAQQIAFPGPKARAASPRAGGAPRSSPPRFSKSRT